MSQSTMDISTTNEAHPRPLESSQSAPSLVAPSRLQLAGSSSSSSASTPGVAGSHPNTPASPQLPRISQRNFQDFAHDIGVRGPLLSPKQNPFAAQISGRRSYSIPEHADTSAQSVNSGDITDGPDHMSLPPATGLDAIVDQQPLEDVDDSGLLFANKDGSHTTSSPPKLRKEAYMADRASEAADSGQLKRQRSHTGPIPSEHSITASLGSVQSNNHSAPQASLPDSSGMEQLAFTAEEQPLDGSAAKDVFLEPTTSASLSGKQQGMGQGAVSSSAEAIPRMPVFSHARGVYGSGGVPMRLGSDVSEMFRPSTADFQSMPAVPYDQLAGELAQTRPEGAMVSGDHAQQLHLTMTQSPSQGPTPAPRGSKQRQQSPYDVPVSSTHSPNRPYTDQQPYAPRPSDGTVKRSSVHGLPSEQNNNQWLFMEATGKQASSQSLQQFSSMSASLYSPYLSPGQQPPPPSSAGYQIGQMSTSLGPGMLSSQGQPYAYIDSSVTATAGIHAGPGSAVNSAHAAVQSSFAGQVTRIPAGSQSPSLAVDGGQDVSSMWVFDSPDQSAANAAPRGGQADSHQIVSSHVPPVSSTPQSQAPTRTHTGTAAASFLSQALYSSSGAPGRKSDLQ